MIKKEPNEIWAEYQKGVEYLSHHNIFDIVKTNEDFFDGRQWEGVSAQGMPKPVINILQRVVKYLIATIGSNDVGISMTPFSKIRDDIELMNPIQDAVSQVIEQAKIKEHSRLVIRNGAVDGSSYMLQTFDDDFETGQAAKGRIENQVLDNTQVYFGNPYSPNIQKQPYIIVALRQHLYQVRQEAERLKVKDIDNIVADSDDKQVNDDSTELVTVLIKYYKENNTVHFIKCTKDVVLIEPTDLEYRRYPISCFGWDNIKNSYLYNSPLTAVIPNQVFINKCYAIAMQYGQQSAFPKVVYDMNKVDIQEFMNSTSPHAVAGIDSMGKFLDFIKVPDFSNNILALVQDIIQQTKECMGVNDASLGNVKPDNTSAIIALQQASAMPLEIQKQQYFEMWEDTVRNVIDIMSVSYGKRDVMDNDNNLVSVDFRVLKDINFHLNVDIGSGAQFSEIAQVQTLDKLFEAQLIDPITYVESIPQKYIINREAILKAIKEATKPQGEN